MRGQEPKRDQTSFLYEGLEGLLDHTNKLYRLANTYPWSELEQQLIVYYPEKGRPAKTIRRMSGLLLLKQMFDLSDETIVEQWVQNPYYQYFCGETEFQWRFPCDASDLVHFRNRIGEAGMQEIFKLSVLIHGERATESTLIADTTVQEKNITFPTDVKLYRKVILFAWRAADREGLELRQRYTRVVRKLLIAQRHRNHKSNYKRALRAQRKLRTIAGRLTREIHRKIPMRALKEYAGGLDTCFAILEQKRGDKNKVYSLHEPDVYCVAKGKEHKSYEFGCKVSILKTQKSGIVVGALSFAKNEFDGHTLEPALKQYQECFGKTADEVIVDRGYKGRSHIGETKISMPRPMDKSMNYRQLLRIREKFRTRAGIEPVIGHLKQDCKLGRNFLKGIKGDMVNALLAAAAFNLRKWMREADDFLSLIFIAVQRELSTVTLYMDRLQLRSA